MIKNYLLIAWRQILKNKLYASINIIGLVVGLAVYIFGSILVSYEESHDTFFKNSDRIFTMGSKFSATADIGVPETDGVYTAIAPFVDAEVDEVELIARTVRREFLLTIGDDNYYQQIRFVDPAFDKIFNFKYLQGDDSALDDPAGLMLTRSSAIKLFGTERALGEVVALDHKTNLHVTAVIEDLPANTHFNSQFVGSTKFEVVAPIAALHSAVDYDLAGNFNNLSSGNFTYMLLPDGYSRAWLQNKIDGIYQAHFPEDGKEFITGFKVRPLVEANTIVWDQIGMPILQSVHLLGFLVLIVAIVNYTNLATAQSMARIKEVGLRKTMGASRAQLLAQFIVESLCIAILAMLIALALLELMVPIFNAATDKAVVLNYVSILPWLLTTTLAVGVVAGLYPAYVITHASPIDALRDTTRKGGKGSLFRSTMLALQFTISIFMLAMVLIMYFQNKKVESASNIYPKSQIITLQRLGLATIQARLETLRSELMKIPGVTDVSYSSQVPYEQNNSQTGMTRTKGDKDASFLMTQIRIDEHFLSTYEIPLIVGRDYSKEVGNDTIKGSEQLGANIIVNELAIEKLGFASPQAALGQSFYDLPDEREPRTYTIVGVIPDQNFMGFHNKVKPTVFQMAPIDYGLASIKISGARMNESLDAIEATWQQLIPEYPIQSKYLEDTFNDVFVVFGGFTRVFGGFAAVALGLSLIGLFGLAAFMAENRTREIGIRKVMGANTMQIVRLLIWQFSIPVMWALLIALPLAYLASSTYLNFFAERLAMPAGIVVFAGLVAVLFAWAIVAIHAVKIASANPIRALRYE